MTRLLYYRYVFHMDAESYYFGDEYGEWHSVDLSTGYKSLGILLSQRMDVCDNGRASVELRWLEPRIADMQNRMHKLTTANYTNTRDMKRELNSKYGKAKQ